MPKKKAFRKKTLEFTADCECGEKSRVFELERGYMVHCTNCGAVSFFDNPQLLERLRFTGKLCNHAVTEKPCKTGTTRWCPLCRIRSFRYGKGEKV